MRYGSEFADAFQEAMKTPEYWMEEVRLDFLGALESALEEKNISQSDLAKKLGKSDAYVSKVMNSDISNFTLKTMVQLAFAIGAKLSVRIGDIEPVGFAAWEESFLKKSVASWNGGIGEELRTSFSNIDANGDDHDGSSNKNFQIAA